MRLTIILEQRFVSTPDKRVWTQTACSNSFWQRYLSVFDKIEVIARIQPVNVKPRDWKTADDSRISFTEIPFYIGPLGYLRRKNKIVKIIQKSIADSEAVLLRVPSQIAWTAHRFLLRGKRPYGVEVVGDPWDVFSPNAVKHPFRWFFRRYFSYQLRNQCANAVAASYVTQFALQKRYPPARNAYVTNYSSIELSSDYFAFSYKFCDHMPKKIVFVGSLAQLYKAPDVLIQAVAILQRRGKDVRLIVIGDGFYRSMLESMARKLDVENRVEFLGQLTSGKSVKDELDKADLFVLPSRTEGLPRAMIEAMARGLPCIGSIVGGMPELLSLEYLVTPGNAEELARKIDAVLSNPGEMARMSKMNIKKAMEFSDDVLHDRREAFYIELKKYTVKWMNQLYRE